MDEEIKMKSETIEKTIKVDDDDLYSKMKDLQYKVKMLKVKMDMLSSKYSTINIVSMDKKMMFLAQ